MNVPYDPRIDAIQEALLQLAQQNFSVQAPISDRLDEVDAVATGLNMLAEELRDAVADKRELEAAYRSLQDTQAQLVHAGKLAAIGQLASGVAHEINNPATWVVNSLELLMRSLHEARAMLQWPKDPLRAIASVEAALEELEHYASDAAQGMERIRSITGDLRTFSRADGDGVEPVALEEVVNSSLSLARPTLRQQAKLLLEIQPVQVLGNKGKLAQVVTNLLVNAAQAVTDCGQAEPKIALELRAVDGRALLSVEDSGPGVPLALRDRIFEPFFTTKPAAEGTGLGLSLVAEIVAKHNGTLSVTSGLLGGARFEVRLPLLAQPPLQPPGPLAAKPLLGAVPARARRSRVLLVDDEPNLLRSCALLLQPDHDVFTAEGGAQALQCMATDRAFDVIICDLQMPHPDGMEVYAQLLEHAPELADRMVFSTGGAYKVAVKEFLARSSRPVLQKPVRPQQLLQTIAEVAGGFHDSHPACRPHGT